ncbi:MAG: VOC family protein [Lapillicoccus sp.]
MTTRTDHNVWPGISYDDAHAARKWLATLGFEEGIFVESPDGERPHEIQHSEMLWPEGGRVMVHTRGRVDDTSATAPGNGNVYVVCDDPDAVWERARALEATVLRPMEDTDYGSRGFSIADAEGNAWSFGTYAGA